MASHLGVPVSFVHKMGSGEKPVPLAHAAAIEQFTQGEVTRRAMFPEDWPRIWPELANTNQPEPTPALAAEAGCAASEGV